MKKLLSLLCACTVAIASLTGFVSVSASAAPSITYELNFENTGEKLSDTQDTDWAYDSLHGVAPLYKATLTLKGAVAKSPVRDDSNVIVAFTGSLVNGVQAAIKYQSSQNVVAISSEVLAGGAAGTDISDPTVLTASWGTATTSQFLKADTVVATWYFFETSGAEITDMKLSADANSINKVVVGEFYDGTSKEAQKNVDVTDITFVNYPAPATTISLDKSSVSLKMGETETATVVATVNDGTAVVWTTSDANVATVANGVITAVGAGSATITATAGTASATVAVTVAAADPVQEITSKDNQVIGTYGDKTLIWVAEVLNKADVLNKKVTLKRTLNGVTEEQVSDRTLATILGGVVAEGTEVTGNIQIGVLSSEADAVFEFVLN